MNNGPHTHSELSEEILQLKVVFFFFPEKAILQNGTRQYTFFSTIK